MGWQLCWTQERLLNVFTEVTVTSILFHAAPSTDIKPKDCPRKRHVFDLIDSSRLLLLLLLLLLLVLLVLVLVLLVAGGLLLPLPQSLFPVSIFSLLLCLKPLAGTIERIKKSSEYQH